MAGAAVGAGGSAAVWVRMKPSGQVPREGSGQVAGGRPVSAVRVGRVEDERVEDERVWAERLSRVAASVLDRCVGWEDVRDVPASVLEAEGVPQAWRSVLGELLAQGEVFGWLREGEDCSVTRGV